MKFVVPVPVTFVPAAGAALGLTIVADSVEAGKSVAGPIQMPKEAGRLLSPHPPPLAHTAR
jgi:hypothetical protein